jgi:putative membrane protein
VAPFLLQGSPGGVPLAPPHLELDPMNNRRRSMEMQQRKTILQTGVVAMAGFLTLLAPAYAQTGSTGSKVSAHDRTFMKEAAQGGMAEVNLGQLAAQNASDPDVKAFGQRMVTDHSKANDQLKQVAAGMNVTLPTDVKASDKAEANRLSKMTGAAFDRAYVRSMVKDHKKDVAEFQKEAKSGHGDVQSFASTTLPTLQEHLKMAEDLQAKMGGASMSHKSGMGH